MNKQLVLLGGGHAHLLTLANLHTFIARGVGVTVIQPSAYHYYSGMGPGMLGGTYQPDELRFATRNLVEAKGGRFILGRAERIDPQRQEVSLEGKRDPIAYDVLSCNTGSSVPRDMVKGKADNIFTAKPIEELLVAQQRVCELAATAQIAIAVIGGGPSSVEIAGNIHQLCREKVLVMPKITLFAGRHFLSGKPERVRSLARGMLLRKGVDILENGYVKSIEDQRITLENSQTYRADLLFVAAGVKPSHLFTGSGLPTSPDGALLVNQFLQSVGATNIFGGGDCISFAPEPLEKVGVYAVRQNPVLYANLLAALENKPLQRFQPGGKYLLIYNLGEGLGIFSKWRITFSGKLAFYLKDRIDRRFIQRFSINA
ncbi:FAD-dependent oxidoreductase [uncultured Vibrio sp.]|uniref:NAD(P)/FAD-dependent oxidoreductase n=1 Tax=uncultured Vibrio sp. TaxID=114054 RepID=UPI002AA9237E|nr:FAD-dependent oxidoreductase [uncultured Vibrio sp.]